MWVLNEISETYVKDQTNFQVLSKKINEFINYLFGLSREEATVEDESIAFESISLIHEVLRKDIKLIAKLKYKLVFSNLIDHFKSQDISLLNEVIQVFKQLKDNLGEIEYSNHLHGYLEIDSHAHIREIIDIYSILFNDLVRIPRGFEIKVSIKTLCKVSHNKLQTVRSTSVRCLDKILVLVGKEDKSIKESVR